LPVAFGAVPRDAGPASTVIIENTVPCFIDWWSTVLSLELGEQTERWDEYASTHRDVFDVFLDGYGRRSDARAALERLRTDPSPLERLTAVTADLTLKLEDAAEQINALLAPPTTDPIPVVLLVGLYTSNAWVTRFRESSTIFVAVETLPDEPFDRVLLTHETAHAYHDRLSPVGWEERRVGHRFVREGLATVASELVMPGLSDSAYLWMGDDKSRWVGSCREQWGPIRKAALDSFETGDEIAYRSLFMGARRNDATRALPPRCGYFAARETVRRIAEREPLRTLAALPPADAEALVHAELAATQRLTR
jgi:hypothetical protein